MVKQNWMRFIAHFEDEVVQGNPLGGKDSGWSSLPDKPILHLEYIMPYGDSIVLHGYDEYLHMIEAVQQVGHNVRVEHVYLMGRRKNLSLSYRITVFQLRPNDRFKIGDITVRLTPKDKEYKGRPVRGWRRGK